MSRRDWVILFAAIGAGLQYLWLDMFDAMSKYATGISFSTFVATVIIAFPLFKLRKIDNILGTRGLRIFVCILASTVAGFTAFLVLASIDRPDAVTNGFIKNPLLFVGLNSLACAGWVVGVFCSLALLIRTMKPAGGVTNFTDLNA